MIFKESKVLTDNMVSPFRANLFGVTNENSRTSVARLFSL